jgi:hypothetical protein
MSYDIEKVPSLPDGARAYTIGVYDILLRDILIREDGVYLIKVGTNKPQTIYQQLYKHMRKKDDFKCLKLHKVLGKVYIVKDSRNSKK